MKKNSILMKITIPALCILLLTALIGCSKEQSETTETEAGTAAGYTLSEEHKVIFDTDTAADDAMALVLAARAPNIDLIGVTVLPGNVSLKQGTMNALMSLEVAGRYDVPVYCGVLTKFSGELISPYSVFGTDGMGDQNLIHPTGEAEAGNAVDFILETVKDNPGEIEILATGPLTNIAKAIEKDPETMKQVKRIWSMGTAGTIYLGDANPVAEFNAYQDIAAYQYVIDSGIPMTIIGFDVCAHGDVSLTEERLETLSDTGECGKFLAAALSTFTLSYQYDDSGYSHACDPVSAAALIWDNFISESAYCDAQCVEDDGPAYGAVIFYEKGKNYDMLDEEYDYHIEVAVDLNGEAYFESVCDLIR